MSIATFSSAMVLIFVSILLCILMDVHYYDLSKKQRWAITVFVLLLAVFNDFLKLQFGNFAYGKIIIFTLHIPVFLLFKYITRCSTIKMTFMIFSALVFTSPAVIVSIIARRVFYNNQWVLIASNIVVYIIMLLLAQFVFRKGFNYLFKYGDDRLFIMFSVIPAFYYIYVFAIQGVDLSVYNSLSGYIIRSLPTLEVFAFYFLILNSYKEINEKKELEISRMTMKQTLDLAEQRIALLNMSQTQTAVYRHDMRHHLNYINSFLTIGKPNQASEYIHKLQNEIESISPKHFCENELINLLCSSIYSKSEKENIKLNINAKIPNGISISDTELCSMVSNALENAIDAVKKLQDSRWVEFYCELKRNKLLIEVKNPYSGKVVISDGLPVSTQIGHGYGCRSIKAITEHHNGLCNFKAEKGIFTLQIVLPIKNT